LETHVNDNTDHKPEVNGTSPHKVFTNGTDNYKSGIHSAHKKMDDESRNLLDTRKHAVDELVEFTTDLFRPTANTMALIPRDDEKVILVTGGSGSLGGHLVYHLVQLDDVKTVVCLTRKHREDAVTRQIKAMRDKGIRFPDVLKSKLVVLQTDSSEPHLGLEQKQYNSLAASVTHVFHQA
jgi:hypothetical protein